MQNAVKLKNVKPDHLHHTSVAALCKAYVVIITLVSLENMLSFFFKQLTNHIEFICLEFCYFPLCAKLPGASTPALDVCIVSMPNKGILESERQSSPLTTNLKVTRSAFVVSEDRSKWTSHFTAKNAKSNPTKLAFICNKNYVCWLLQLKETI